MEVCLDYRPWIEGLYRWWLSASLARQCMFAYVLKTTMNLFLEVLGAGNRMF